MRIFTPQEQKLIDRAIKLLEERLSYGEPISLTSPTQVEAYLKLRFAGLEHEEFHVLFLDSQNRMIAAEAMFRGSLTQTAVYPREIVKLALRHNAAGVIFAHNHPSGVPEPSNADRALTNALKQALIHVDVHSLDHIIVAHSKTFSFANAGLM